EGNLVVVAPRDPAYIAGNGRSTAQQLVDDVDKGPRCAIGHERGLTAMTVNHMSQRLLTFECRALEDVLVTGERLYLKSTAHLSTVGTACDVTDRVHQDVWLMCERVAPIIGMDCIGIDIVAPVLDPPL
ncbi:MAG: cyanophycin synthetase, partial [Roseovarius sp.]